MSRWRGFFARLCGGLAAIFLAAMVLLTVADVTLRAAFNIPLRGTYEVIELLLAATFFVALPASFLRDDHIRVEIIDNVAPRQVRLLGRLAEGLALILLAVIAWQGFIAAGDAVAFNDVTADLGLPRILHWSALLVGIVGAALAALVMTVRRNGQR